MSLIVVVIGRNEGERLERCLRSIVADNHCVIYVDSGSTDRSVELARSLDIDVVELDSALPFTAARARNVGWRRGVELSPTATAVQFVDGDCEIAPGWLDAATAFLDSHPTCAVVCGRLRERFPDATIYNRLCDLEWDTPVGTTDSCGGVACIRLASLQSAGGFRDEMIAGEEPELCFRLRQAGGTIVRLDCEMARHDASMTSFRQWWKRSVRCGHAYAEAEALTSNDPIGLWHREVRSAWLWGAFLPLTSLLLAWPTNGWSLTLLFGYVLLAMRITLRFSRRVGWRVAACYAVSCVADKFAQVVGMLRYRLGRWLRRPSRILEHKPVPISVVGGRS